MKSRPPSNNRAEHYCPYPPKTGPTTPTGKDRRDGVDRATFSLIAPEFGAGWACRRAFRGRRGRKAKNHFAVNPHDAEVTLGPTLFYPLPARRQGRLPSPDRRPRPLPRL